jgi:polyribonucleotide nucleotidyltransferase
LRYAAVRASPHLEVHKLKNNKMEQLATIRLELGINAQKFIQQVQLHHGTIEEQIAKGIELALNDLCEGDNFVQSVREATKQELSKIVNKAVFSWETQSKIEKLVAEKISKKVEAYADTIAEKVTASLGS